LKHKFKNANEILFWVLSIVSFLNCCKTWGQTFVLHSWWSDNEGPCKAM